METFNRMGSLYLACNENCAFSLLNNLNNISCGIVKKCMMLDNIVIRFGSKLYRQIVGNPMGTNCAPLVADLFVLFCYERDFILNLYSTSRYIDVLLNIDQPYFEQIVG